MRKTLLALTIAATATLGACSRESDGDVQVRTPDVDVSTDTTTITPPAMPDVDVGMKQDTMIVNRPTVDVNRRDTTTRP